VPELKAPISFRFMSKQEGYSEKAIREVWKWYDFSEKKGINF
jgi:hypothetical protein